MLTEWTRKVRLFHFSTYAFIYLAALGLSCGTQLASCRLSSCGPWAPERMDSVIAEPRLRCSKACGILVPQAEIEPTSPTLQVGFLTTGPPMKSPSKYFEHLLCLSSIVRVMVYACK